MQCDVAGYIRTWNKLSALPKHAVSSPTPPQNIYEKQFLCLIVFCHQVTSGDPGWTSSQPQTRAGQASPGASSAQGSIQSHQRRAALQTLPLRPESDRVSWLHPLVWPLTSVAFQQNWTQRLTCTLCKWAPRIGTASCIYPKPSPLSDSNYPSVEPSISAICSLLSHITGKVLKWCNSDAKWQNVLGNSSYVTIHASNLFFIIMDFFSWLSVKCSFLSVPFFLQILTDYLTFC